MKTIKVKRFLTLILLILVILISGCSKEFDVPPVTIPKFTLPDGATLITIKELNNRHTIPGAVDSINDDVYVCGKVISSDESGNIYKTLYLQDTSGGLVISVDLTDMYTKYRLGQKMYISCKGLFLGDYGGMTQLGSIYNGGIGRIAEVDTEKHFFLDSLPGSVPEAKLYTIATLNSNALGTLIKLENVSLIEVGQPFSDPSATTNRTITDGTNSLIMRNSNYADFAATAIPDGSGTIYGILSIFNGDLQLYIRDLNDLVGFDYSTKLIINESFSASGSLGTFTEYSVTGNEKWIQSSFSSTTFAKMSGYNSGSYFANEDWLISPSMNLDDYSGEVLKFFSMMNYGTAGDGSLTVYYSTNYVSGNPNLANWTQLTGFALSTGSWANVPSGDIDLSGIAGTNVHVAFKYTCSTTNVSTWEIGGILVKGTLN